MDIKSSKIAFLSFDHDGVSPAMTSVDCSASFLAHTYTPQGITSQVGNSSWDVSRIRNRDPDSELGGWLRGALDKSCSSFLTRQGTSCRSSRCPPQSRCPFQRHGRWRGLAFGECCIIRIDMVSGILMQQLRAQIFPLNVRLPEFQGIQTGKINAEPQALAGNNI